MRHGVIIGASGIVGNNLVKKMECEGGWRITGVARRKCPEEFQGICGLDWISCDITEGKSCKEKLCELADTITHLFYVVWQGRDDPEEEVTKNHEMFRSVMKHLSKGPKLRFVYLQTGSKYYGSHLGPKYGQVFPYRETDLRLDYPNFYYALEDELAKCHKKSDCKWHYTIGRPTCILGHTKGTQMNFGNSLAAYAMVLKELGMPLIYPYSKKSYKAVRDFVDAKLLAEFALWASAGERRLNLPINLSNGDYVTMETLWPKLARYFGMDYEISPGAFDIQSFMSDKDEVWNRIVEKHNLEKLSLKEIGTFGFLHDILHREWSDATIVHRARVLGFGKSVHTEKDLFRFFDELQLRKVVPCLPQVPLHELEQVRPKEVGCTK